MILVLKGADFSANNIGTVPVARYYQDETLAILANYTKSLTDAQKNAVDDFVIAIKNAGVYGKLSTIVLPPLANSTSEAIKNALNGNAAFGGNTNGVALSNGALGVVENADIATLLAGGVSGNNMSISLYVATKNHTGAYNRALIGRSNSSGNFYQFLNYTSTGDSIKVQTSGGTFTSNKTTGSSFVLSFDGTELTFIVDGTVETYTFSEQNTETINNFRFGIYNKDTYAASGTVAETKDTISFIAIGTKLTQTEATALNTAITTLMSELL